MQGWEISTDTPLRAILDWCLSEHQVDRLLLSARLEKGRRKSVFTKPSLEQAVTSLFGDRLLTRKVARKWPGTELIGHDGMIFVIAFDSSLVDPMCELGETLGAWLHSRDSPLPEDPCLYKQGDDCPVLVSVTHERDAWILSNTKPPFCVKALPFQYDPKNLLVPPASRGFMA
jgi:hypothetical protein